MRKLAPSIVVVLLAVAVFATSTNGQKLSPWSEAVKVASPINGIGTTQDGCPFIAKNDLDLYFRSNRPGGYGGFDIYVSHRDTVDDPWETPINLGPKINSTSGEFCSFVTIDGHWLYFVSNRPVSEGGCGGQDIWVSHRKDKRDDVGWETPKNLGCGIINSTANEHGPSLFEDEATGQTVLYFGSDRPGGVGGSDIYASQMLFEDKETFGTPSPVAELNTAANDLHPFVRRKDALEVIFVSSRTDSSASGGQDLWVSSRPDTSSPWSPPVNLGPLINSPYAEGRPSLSWDGTTLYFFTSRNSPAPTLDNLDVYMATRTKLKGKDKDPD